MKVGIDVQRSQCVLPSSRGGRSGCMLVLQSQTLCPVGLASENFR